MSTVTADASDFFATQWNRLRQGDETALKELFTAFHADLCQYGARLSGNEELARDCVQVVFLNLWQRRARLVEVRKVKAYLFQALRHELLKKMERQQRHSLLHQEIGHEFYGPLFSPEELVVDAERAEEQRRVLAQALNHLSAREREVIYLRYFEGLNCTQISEIMGIGYQPVLNCLYRACQRLRKDDRLRQIADLTLVAFLSVLLA
ncbi:RNA polymerase sigma factor, sigma-70 family [Catalinimonas alkaloidigena]|uniref:RNA polymerase sigma factor, sigma-70 family n=1 Tax=Catalinimonas alkaloidigena TaxID=1075417 RepID=A0A1G9HK38_9BACT|nr:sigma-70 family RNA polymerase sigma factor [Catalinimonas alkaloidigena]SDL13340.1 RNA polymerase sigma factor, sigma-70 family [Catalinimonas alkaloidigena]